MNNAPTTYVEFCVQVRFNDFCKKIILERLSRRLHNYEMFLMLLLFHTNPYGHKYHRPIHVQKPEWQLVKPFRTFGRFSTGIMLLVKSKP